MHDVAADQPKRPLQVQRAHYLAAKHGGFEVRSIFVDGVDHEIGDRSPVRVPRLAVGKLRSNMLAKEAGNVLPWWGQTVIQRRWDQNLHDELLRPSKRERSEENIIN